MPLSRRYSPEHPPLESCVFGIDFSAILPVGISIAGGQLDIFKNVTPYAAADSDWTKGPIYNVGRVLCCNLTGGVEGTDYQLRWQMSDTAGNVWYRTGLVLCAQTS